MALKYWAEFRDVNAVLIRIEISDDAYNGDASEMVIDGKGCSMSYPEKDIHEPIFSLGAELNIYCTKSWSYSDLFATSERKSKVTIYRDGSVVFIGFIEPNLYEQEWLHPPYFLKIPANDGLTALENYVPDIAANIGMMRLIDVIKSCLSQTGLEMPIMVCCSLFEENQNVDAYTIFDVLYVEYLSLQKSKDGNFDANDAKTVLSDILKPFNCRIYQANGMWYIERVKNKCDGYRWRKYNANGSEQWITGDTVTTLDTDDMFFVENPAAFTIDSGYGKLTVKSNVNKYSSVILNNYQVGIKYACEGWFWDMKRWWLSTLIPSLHNTSQSVVVPVTGFEGINQGFKIDNATIGAANVFQKSMISLISGDKNVKLKFKCVVRRNVTQKDTKKFRMVFSLCFSPLDFYLYNDGEKFSIEHISRIPTNKHIPKGFTYFESKKDNNRDILNEYETFEVNIEVDCTYDFNLYPILRFAPVFGNAYLPPFDYVDDWIPFSSDAKYVKESYYGDVELIVDEKNEYEDTYAAVINNNYRREAPEVDVKFNNTPKIKTYRRDDFNWNINNGIYKLSDGAFVNIGKIGEIGSLAKNTLVEQLIVDRFSQYYDPSAKISGDVYTERFISPEQLFRLNGRAGCFLMTGNKYDLGESQFSVKLEEIKDDEIIITE